MAAVKPDNITRHSMQVLSMFQVATKRVGAVVAALGISLIAASCDKSEPVQLQLRLQEGDRYNLQMTSNQSISQTVMGQQQNINQNVGVGYLFDVTNVEADGTMAVKITYDSIQFKQGGPMGALEYDSSQPAQANHPMAGVFTALKGQTLSAKITPDGNLQELQGLDQMISQMVASMKLPNGAAKTEVENAIRSQFGEESFKELFEQSMNMYPEEPIEVGESWKKTITISKGFPMVLETTYTLKEVKNDIATLDVLSNLKSNPGAAPLKMGPATLKYDLAGTQKGTMQLQVKTGALTQTQLDQDISGQIEIQGAPGMTQPMSWPISVKSVTTIQQTKS